MKSRHHGGQGQAGKVPDGDPTGQCMAFVFLSISRRNSLFHM
jgi:hypothetical protein